MPAKINTKPKNLRKKLLILKKKIKGKINNTKQYVAIVIAWYSWLEMREIIFPTLEFFKINIPKK